MHADITFIVALNDQKRRTTIVQQSNLVGITRKQKTPGLCLGTE